MKQIITYKAVGAKGNIDVHAEGGVAVVQADGDVVMNMRTIRSVGIENLSEVTEHHITTIVGSSSHMVRFANGGTLQYAYNDTGQLIELIAQSLDVTISQGDSIRFAIPKA